MVDYSKNAYPNVCVYWSTLFRYVSKIEYPTAEETKTLLLLAKRDSLVSQTLLRLTSYDENDNLIEEETGQDVLRGDHVPMMSFDDLGQVYTNLSRKKILSKVTYDKLGKVLDWPSTFSKERHTFYIITLDFVITKKKLATSAYVKRECKKHGLIWPSGNWSNGRNGLQNFDVSKRWEGLHFSYVVGPVSQHPLSCSLRRFHHHPSAQEL